MTGSHSNVISNTNDLVYVTRALNSVNEFYCLTAKKKKKFGFKLLYYSNALLLLSSRQNQVILLDTLEQEVTKFRECNAMIDLNALVSFNCEIFS